uniref:ATPase subunit 8 n=1 Tax=Physopelta sp. TaxID=2931303 RepID=A0A8T9ZWS9_9HEMI|nr:ATPase subunit 8 [Physopelta sp.]
MPQMAPMWWELLFMMTLMLYTFMSTIIYFNKENKLSTKTEKISKSEMNLKW